MFHLIKKYSNRQLYDTCTKKFMTQDDIIALLVNKEEIRVEDSGSHIDITELEVSKAIMRYIKNGNELPEMLKDLIAEESPSKRRKKKKQKEEEVEAKVVEFIPAEIRVLTKASDYIRWAIATLMTEEVFNQKIHEDLYTLCVDFEKKLEKLKKKHKM